MPSLRSGSRVLLPLAMTTAIGASLLAAPAAGALSEPAQVPIDESVAAPSRADAGGTQPADRFIVKFRQDPAAAPGSRGNAYGRVAKELGIPVRELKETAGGAVVVEATGDVSSQAADAVVGVLNAHPDVEYAEIDVLLHPLATPNDQYYQHQWNLHEDTAGLRTPGAWDRSTGLGQTIAILDTGITEHSDLAANVLPGYDFIGDPALAADGNGRDPNPSDPGDACASDGSRSSWHGTHVAGTAGAVGNNSKGVVGVAYGAKLLPLRVIGACGGRLSDTVDAVRWAVGGIVSGAPLNLTPARVINMSLGAEAVCQASMQSAIDFAVQRGSVVIAAAGNESQPAANVSPANCRNVVTVGATSRAGDSASYSNYGPELDVSAPGGDGNTGAENILSTVNSGTSAPAGATYGYMQGTSMAAPHVAGVAALMLSVNPLLSPAQIEQTLRDTARSLPGTCTGGCGTGIVDADAAVARVASEAFSPSLRSEADVVAADSAGTLWNYPSNGAGGFSNRVKIGSGWSSLKSGFVTDWNQDGVLDMVAQWKDGRLTVYPGKYAGGFGAAQAIGTGWRDYFVTVGQWRSGDRFPGIVATDPNGALWFYGNGSGGALSGRTAIGTGWKGLYLTMTDFDGDSRMDILAKKADGKLIQYRSDGAGRFLSESRTTIGTGWGIIDSMTDLPGFNGMNQQGIMTRLTDGRLAYYPFANGVWGARTIAGSGWGGYNLFR
ncbi:serine protease [Arthrobacter subterraneus]|uniref:Serine protease n=1 Tax=Arthrobacter subterraneus TaxID=335973 RepID=A0A1G8FYH3_9MICC|nr:S8 family serine peptidase [Arthrobacter subterraneus]SDH87189.1 serine protease [Arthrobacter subterraneus]